MIGAGRGLTQVSTEALKTLLRAVLREEIAVPLTFEELTRCGLQHCASELLDTLRGLDERAVKAVLMAVLAERLPRR